MDNVTELTPTPGPDVQPMLDDIRRRFDLESDARKGDVIAAISENVDQVMRNK